MPGYEHEPWNGMFAPAEDAEGRGREAERGSRPHPATPEVKKVFEHEGADPVGNSPEQFAAILKSEIAKWMKVVKAAGIKPSDR